jgi:hypothetical protein
MSLLPQMYRVAVGGSVVWSVMKMTGGSGIATNFGG